MTFEQLLYIADLAQTHSLTTTAEHFFISRQAVSKAIKNLEEELSVILLKRTNKGISLTDAGESILADCLAIKKAYNNIYAKYPQTKTSHVSFSGLLHIIAVPEIIDSFFYDWWIPFSGKYSNIELTISSASHNNIIASIIENKTDIGLCSFSQDTISSHLFQEYLIQNNLKFVPIFTQEMIGVVHKKYNLPDETLNLMNNNHLPLIGYKYLLPQELPKNKLSTPLTPFQNIQYEVDSIFIMKKLVESQKGIGIISKKIFDKFFTKTKSIRVIPLYSSYLFYYGYLINTSISLKQETVMYIDFIKKINLKTF